MALATTGSNTITRTKTNTALAVGTIVYVSIVASVASIIFNVLSENNSNNYGYGYGYGYGVDCTVSAPSNVQIRHFPRQKNLRASWQAPDTTMCNTSVDHYEIVVVRGTSSVLTLNTTTTTKTIYYRQLPGRGNYSLLIRLYTTDGDVSDWSTALNFSI